MTVQWHITTDCQNRCKHCYVFDDKTYNHEKNYPLSLEQKIEVLDQLDTFSKKWDIQFKNFAIMGGDPLLASDFFPFAEELVRRGKKISLGGNPDLLTDENLEKLQKLGVTSYQISLDGLEETHDLMRRKGSFQASVEGYKKLARYNIKGSVMATLTPLNIDEFFQLIDFVFYETEAKLFAFDFVSQVGEGTQFSCAFTPEQVLELSRRYLKVKEEYGKIKPEFHFSEKPGPMRMLRIADESYVKILDEGETAPIAGCLIGNNSIDILSDGTMLSCRRFPEIIGRVPKDNIEDILLGSEILKKYRRPQFWEQCGKCIGWNICRGCPAISYGESKEPFKAFSLCYAELLGIPTYQEHEPISMDTTYEEEVNVIKKNLQYHYLDEIRNKTLPKLVSDIIIKLATNEAYLARYKENTEAFFEREGPELFYKHRKYIAYRYNYLVAVE